MFLGDGGAYLIGALLSFYIIMLSFRNLEVAPFSLFFLVIFPIYELLRTTIRRTFSNSAKAIEPDTKHLHSMIFKFIFALKKNKLYLWQINAISSIFTLFFPLFGCFIGLLTIFFEDYQIYFPLLVLLYLFITELTFYLIEKELKLNNKL